MAPMVNLKPLQLNSETRIRRLAQHQTTDREELFAILDKAMTAHVAIVRDGKPVALPLGFARDGDSILVHGSTGSDFFRRLAAGTPACVNVTHLDGLIFARSLFDSSMRYRAAVIHGIPVELRHAEKEAGLLALARHLMPGRAGEVRPISQRELAATMVLRISLDSASVKNNHSSTAELPDDGEDRSVWAGQLPLRVVAGLAETSSSTRPGVPVPVSVAQLRTRINKRQERQ